MMTHQTTDLLWLVGSLAFVVGLLLGGGLWYFLSPQFIKRNSQQKCEEIATELKMYKAQVNDHFDASAHLLNKLTEDYKDLHEYLAGSAEKLCTDQVVRHKLSDALVSTSTLLSKTQQANAQQPKDYAPKDQMNSESTLSEGFGINAGSTIGPVDKKD